MRTWLSVAGGVAVLAAAWGAFRIWPRSIPVRSAKPVIPVVEFRDGVAAVVAPGRVLVAEAATFDDELFAYLMSGYLRGLAARDGCRAWLTYERREKSIVYVVQLAPRNDLLAGLFYLNRLEAATRLRPGGYRWVIPAVVAAYEAQTRIFDNAYRLPARSRLELLPRAELAGYIRRFIRFKAETDGRVERGADPAARPPTVPEAHRLAEDIVTIADFYALPLDFFLGIGAMENNYMNVKGDLGNAIWKRRAQKGDVILKRGSKGVLVLNESSGIWQITRETLRYAHRLFLKDKRDYSLLPERLRPAPTLNLDDVPPEVLTTYAGLLFRDLLDRFQGDVTQAVGAYNGGPGNPNLRYEAGVRLVADYARRMLEHAATLRGSPAAEMRFLAPAQ